MTPEVKVSENVAALLKKRLRPGEDFIQVLLVACALVSVLTTVGIILALLGDALRFFATPGFSWWDFLTGTYWEPGSGHFGILALITGTLMTSLVAMVVAVPVGMAIGIYLSEYASARVSRVLKPVLEILAGIPSIVYGYFAINFVTPSLQAMMGDLVKPLNALSAGIVMGIWGLESNYGQSTGGFNVIEALATLAWEGRRAAFFRSELMDALKIPNAHLAGYDWGGRAACVVAALWPERCKGLVSFNSYNIQHIAKALVPDTPENEHRLWYQYYFHSERGRAGLQQDRQALIRLLWRLWSPTWGFDDATFARSAPSFDNADFVDVVIHSYRHRYGLVDGDPAYADIERRLAQQPAITVPSITFDGADDGVRLPSTPDAQAHRFTGPRSHRVVPGVGHNMPQENPTIFAQAILELIRSSS